MYSHTAANIFYLCWYGYNDCEWIDAPDFGGVGAVSGYDYFLIVGDDDIGYIEFCCVHCVTYDING